MLKTSLECLKWLSPIGVILILCEIAFRGIQNTILVFVILFKSTLKFLRARDIKRLGAAVLMSHQPLEYSYTKTPQFHHF